eukprot:TRINITY_DN4026_c0_g1_i3.p1 TRINITY_DN4026_c0_g1~~TRINITY_DN4026_c0_g1_i3.p1  ORF type:complete len:303 (+),score=28.79 TRINITY_DN4026_c0_g1_i3:64-972(+)
MSDKSKVGVLQKMLNLGIGGIAGCMGLCMIYPIETLKTMIQLNSSKGGSTKMRQVFKTHMATEKFVSLYKGLPAALCRQFLFASIRLGLFFNIADYIKNKQKKNTLSILESTTASLAAATIGISTVMPFDVIFVRYQSENTLPLEQRRGYTGLGNAISRIVKEEGLVTLWRGILPAIARACALNFGMLVPYDKAKGALSPYLGFSRTNYIVSAAIAGFMATVCCIPFDNAKVKLQSMKAGADGVKPYKGLLDVFAKTAQKEGIRGLWTGFLPFYSFLAPHTILTLLISDALRIVLGLSLIHI